MTVTRRQAGLITLGASLANGLSSSPSGAQKVQAGERQPYDHDMSQFPAGWVGREQIAFLIYPEFTALDLVGPHYMLAGLLGAKVHIVAKTKEPITSDQKLTFVPTGTFEECPKDLDILCVPGGTTGTLAAMEDRATIEFLKDRGSRAKYITSVCTGALIIGAAGLLRGYRATSHWAAREVLRDLGAEPVDSRVVVDRNRITGAGVTAGIDFGLRLLAMLRDQTYAEAMQLLAEYDPAPPFNAGTLEKAPEVPAKLMQHMLLPFGADARAVAKRVSEKW